MKSFKKSLTLLAVSILMITTAIFANARSAILASDAAITADVMSKLAANPITTASNINVQTKDRNVVLSGTVKTDAEVDAAVETAESVRGVKNVDSRLVVPNSPQVITDTVITAKIKGLFLKEKIFGNKPIAAATIRVETQNGRVVLTGTADNRKQIQQATRIARSVKGVKSVVAHVEVKPNNV